MSRRLPPEDITEILGHWQQGDDEALERLLPLVYAELRQRAEGALKGESRDLTLQTHDLVHETVLRLMEQNRVAWRNRGHFFAISVRMMRRILVDQGRRRNRRRRGGGAEHLVLDEVPESSTERTQDLVALDEALNELSRMDAELAQIVELYYFGGLKDYEIAEAVGLSEATVRRRLRAAKAWLYRCMTGDESEQG